MYDERRTVREKSRREVIAVGAILSAACACTKYTGAPRRIIMGNVFFAVRAVIKSHGDGGGAEREREPVLQWSRDDFSEPLNYCASAPFSRTVLPVDAFLTSEFRDATASFFPSSSSL